MPLYRIHAYNDEHHATLIIDSDMARAGDVARELVAAMDLGHYPADHQRRWPELVRIETATSWFDADAPFAPIVERIEAVGPEALGGP